jgi:hypothetical protein
MELDYKAREPVNPPRRQLSFYLFECVCDGFNASNVDKIVKQAQRVK